MKRKILRVLFAVVLALSLSLVMATPVAAFVTPASVENDPTTISRVATYTITFDTTEDLYATDGDTISITFPIGTTVSTTTADYNTKVTVNDDVCANGEVTAAGQKVTMIVDKDVPIGEVTVVIAAGITNPGDVATDWTLDVQTNEEPSDIESETYSTTAITAPTIVSVVGTAYQNSNDTMVITFSEGVRQGSDPWTWDNGALTIKCGGSTVVITGADFNPATGLTETLTITLDESEAYLETGTDNLEVTPVSGEIDNFWDDASVAVTPVLGSVGGDTVAPTVALTYSDDDQLVKENDNLVITATFSEAMQTTPTIAIDTQGTDLEAVAFTGGSGAIWTYTYVVTAGSDGEATVTVVGKDLAGTANQAATNNTFVIDNTAPFVAVTGIIGSTTGTDTIAITFSEDVVASDDTWDANEVTSITLEKTDETDVPVNLGGAEYAYASKVLTIELAEAGADTADKDYLLNGYTLTVDPADVTNTIEDLAGNLLDTDAVEGTTPVTGDLEAPAIIGIVGVGADTIQIAFSELVVAFDDSWSANEFSIESPDGAPLNINNATFNSGEEDVATTVLTIVLKADPDAAVLVEGEVICVTPTADAVVDLAGNSLVALEVNSGADSGWLDAWVDDDWSNQATVDASDPSLIWLTNAWGTIQDGIDAVAEGGTVNVLPGTYVLDANTPLTIVTARLTLQSTGTTAETIIDAGAVDGGAPQDGSGILVNAADVTVDGFTVEDANACGIYLLNAENAIIQDNVITTGSYAGGIDVSVYATGVMVSDNELNEHAAMWLHGSDCMVSGNTFGGLLFFNADGLLEGVTITGNTFPANVSAKFGIILSGGSAPATIDDALIEGNTLDTRTDAGIHIGADSSGGLTVTNLTITGNDITDQGTADGNTTTKDSGIHIWSDAVWGEGNTINNNNITGSDDYGILNEMTDDVEVDATDNWWGDANGPSLILTDENTVSAGVAYSPWLDAPDPYGKSIETTGHFAIDLHIGWNLISLPLIPTDSNVDVVLAELEAEGSVIEVRAFLWEAGEPGQQFWLPATSTLDLMEDGWGYWINMSEADALVVTGSEQAAPGGMQRSYNLYEGWNLIGFKSLSPNEEVINYLGPAIAGSYDGEGLLIAAGTLEVMYSYNAATEVYTSVVPTDKLVPGQGYWLAVNEDGTIYP